MSNGIIQFELYGILIAILCATPGLSSEIPESELTEDPSIVSKPIIIKLMPELENGRGYKLIYLVDAPLEIFWRFKTDFDNQFLVDNKFITSHRFVSRDQNVVVTETEYTSKPKKKFRWQTTLLADQYLLEFKLLNPEECGQNYHYGYIQLEPLGFRTRVIQVAYFDFFGVSIWVNYPFYGGMSYFLKYTAEWEQQTILQLKDRYLND